MIKVGLWGVENTHAEAFFKSFTENPALSAFTVTHVGGAYPESVARLQELSGAAIAESPEEMAACCDCGMITCRDGKYHLAAALPFLRRRRPIFLDKPLTASVSDVEELGRELKKNGMQLIGGSSVKIAPAVDAALAFLKGKTLLSGHITCPIKLENPYGGFSFYASHLAETLLRVFGSDVQSVEMKPMAGGLYGTVFYEHYPVTFTYLDGVYDYVLEADTQEGVFQSAVDISAIHDEEALAFSRFVLEGRTDFSFYELSRPVYLIAAMEASLRSGRREPVGSLPEELL